MQKQDWLICGVLTLFSGLVFASFRPWALPVLGDVAIFQLFGRLIAHGQVPYRDFFDHKTPLTSYANAGPALFSRAFGTDLIVSTRVLSLVLATTATVGMYLLGRATSLSRTASVAIAGTFLAFDFSSRLVAFGLEAKALATYAGIFAMLAAYRSRWAASGTLSSLAFLAWQPAGTFLVAVAARLVAREDERSGNNVGRIIVGFIIPIGVLLVYLSVMGALDDFWRDTVTFNRDYVTRQFDWMPPIGRAADVINTGFSSERWIFLLASVGAGLWVLQGIHGFRMKSVPTEVIDAAPLAVVSASVLAYSYVNFSASPDVLPFLPWIAFWTGWLLHRLMQQIRFSSETLAAVGAIALLVYGHHGLWDRLPHLDQDAGRATEQAIVRNVEQRAGLTDGDKIYAVDEPWFVLASGRENVAAPYYYLWSGVMNLIRDKEGFDDALVRPLLEQRPKLVVLGPQKQEWLNPADRSVLQEVLAGTLLPNYERLPPSGPSAVLVTRAADYWLAPAGPDLEYAESLQTIQEFPGFIGGWSAQDMGPIEGDPTLVLQPASGRITETEAWSLAGNGPTEAIGRIEITVPEDFDTKKGRLYFSILIGLTEDGEGDQRAALELQIEPQSATAEDAIASLDVGSRRSGDVASVDASSFVLANAGDTLLVTIKRDANLPIETYPHDIHVLGLAVSYQPPKSP